MKMLKNNNKMKCKDLNIMMNKKIPDIYNYSKKEKAENINIINNIKHNQGITLIALVITIIVLLILAGVSLAMLTGENGILTKAQQAKEETKKAAKEESERLNSLEDYLKSDGGYSPEKKVNEPQLMTGMTEVMFQLPEGSNKGTTVKNGETGFDSSNWYDYNSSKWANAQTEDGSMWVWIPRYAYKITYTNASDKSKGGAVDVKFLIGTTDEYYDENGERKTAKRATSANEVVDTTSDYYVHPAFTNESSIGYANGGWDKELRGIWVAKFEAGYASGNNSVAVKASSVNYSQSAVWVRAVEAGTSADSGQTARNWLDGIYGRTTTAIKYPTFQAKTYSMNYTNINDAYNISRAMTESGNIYGFNSNTDSHLMKNSEWGAVSYLSQSKYGTNGVEPYINNINLNSGDRKRTETAGKSGVDSVYAVTGVTTGTTDGGETKTTIDTINGTTGNTANSGIYTWDQIEGQKASSTLNMYGIYDLSGGVWERTAEYTPNGNGNLKAYGSSVVYDGNTLKTTSTKYTTVYPFDSTKDNTEISSTEANLNEASKANYLLNTKIFGDAIRETSTSGTGITSWNNDYSYFPGLDNPFAVRGGTWRYCVVWLWCRVVLFPSFEWQ